MNKIDAFAMVASLVVVVAGLSLSDSADQPTRIAVDAAHLGDDSQFAAGTSKSERSRVSTTTWLDDVMAEVDQAMAAGGLEVGGQAGFHAISGSSDQIGVLPTPVYNRGLYPVSGNNANLVLGLYVTRDDLLTLGVTSASVVSNPAATAYRWEVHVTFSRNVSAPAKALHKTRVHAVNQGEMPDDEGVAFVYSGTAFTLHTYGDIATATQAQGSVVVAAFDSQIEAQKCVNAILSN